MFAQAHARFGFGGSAVTSRSSRFGAKLKIWSLAVVAFFIFSFNADPVFAHKWTDPPVPPIDADLFRFFGH